MRYRLCAAVLAVVMLLSSFAGIPAAQAALIQNSVSAGSSSWQNRLAAGEYHSVYVRDDGTVAAAGRVKDGRCKVDDWEDIIAVSAYNHTVGLKSDGTVVAVGANSSKQCNVSKWEDIIDVAAGQKHTLGLRSDGTETRIKSDRPVTFRRPPSSLWSGTP